MMKTQSFASKRRSLAGRHVVFAGRLFAAAGMILLLTLTSWLPAAPAALAQAPTADFTQASASPAVAGETCVVLQPGPAAMNDSYIKQDRPDELRGADIELRVKTENTKLNRALLQFDLSSIPSDATVNSATLSLWVKEVRDGNVSINARALTNSWNEAQVTWKARDKAANLLWTAQGGDYDPAVLDTKALTVGTTNVWASWNVTSAAASWVANSANNRGVILESPVTNPKNETRFKSSDDGTASQRPKLEVCYGAGLTLTPDNQGAGVAGQEKIYAHTVTVGNLTTVVNLSAASNRGWIVTIYQDVNGNGIKDGGDTPITATPPIGPNANFKILVGVQVPFVVPLGAIDVTTVTATAVNGGASASATDTTRVGAAIAVQPNNSTFATAGSGVFYGHTITNNTEQNACYTVTATSNQGWTVNLWEDLNRNGVHEVTNPAEPAVTNPVCLPAGQTYWLVAEVLVPGVAVAGTVDRTVIRAVDTASPGTFGTATDTTTVFVNDPPIVDGKYDDIYNISPDSDVVCYNDPSGTLFGKLATFYQPTADAVYMVLAIDKDFVDNTYGVNAIGWPSGHSFSQLVGSDHAQFYGYNAAGATVLDFKLDYITLSSGTPSGYASLGVSGGDGRMNIGSAASIQEWGTSLAYSLNNTGYCTGGNCSAAGTNLLVNSPLTNQFYTPNPTYPDWIYDVIYEIKINKNAFTGGFGSIQIPYIHASPSKLGTNTIYAIPGACPGEIGDYVWHDVNRDGVQDNTEQGIDNVDVQLYRDNGDGIFNPAQDTLVGTQTTTAGGKYLFQNLPAGDYWVNVVESTVPDGYSTTTYNSPMLVNLDEGESYLDADFGYAIPSTVDYGDAPDTSPGTGIGNYNTLASNNGPSHQIVGTLKLGNVAPDGDSGFLQNVDATADDLTNVQDEDGVAVPPQILETSTSVDLTVRASNTAATPATLACWIDFDRDGVFENNFERASTTVPANSGTADYALTFNGLSGLVAGDSYLRCRIAYEASQVDNATGAANSGEIEDYKVTIGPQPDYGDAPDANPGTGQGNYQTRAADGGPSHVIVNNLRLGLVAPDGDNGTLQNVDATADDTTNIDDEDGVTTLPVITNNSTSVPLAVSVFNDTGADATVACWIDFNRNGVFGDTGEGQSAIVPSQAGQQTVNLTFSGFGTPTPGDSFLRCRIANAAGEVDNAIGSAASGEVEDFKVTILGLDYGDAPDGDGTPTQGSYNTLASNNGPSHVIVDNLRLGLVAPDADSGTLQNVDASADDDTGIPDDEDGVDVLPDISVNTTSVPLTVKAVNATGADATVACWIDFNRNGLFELAERASGVIPPGGTHSEPLTFTGFGTPVAGDSYLRCRIASAAGEVANPTGEANSGEVEDYRLTIVAQQLDFGDAPDTRSGTGRGEYNTTSADNGPRHVIVPGLQLGEIAPDADDGTLQNDAADADDRTNINDEDGVKVLPAIDTKTEGVQMIVSASNDTAADATLVCWIDFNRNGVFGDNGEKSSLVVPAQSGLDDYDVNFAGFELPTEGLSYLRCRIANNATEVQNPIGLAQSGEVEDYPVSIDQGDVLKVGQIGNFVWIDENSDGYQDAGEPGIPNVTVVLYGVGGQEIARTVTDTRGQYLFTKLPAGTYYVDVFDGTDGRAYTLPKAGMEQTPPSTLPGGDFGNQNHNMTSIPTTAWTGYQVKLLAGQENLTADFGYNYRPSDEVNDNKGLAAIGDRVWIDANGDGKQDPEEVGLPDVTVTLYYDPDGDGVYSTPYPGGSTTTDATGYYIFNDLPAGAYVVRVSPPPGYTQTGDPDLWGAWCSAACDNQTTTPVILAPGDVFLNADFGYQPPASQNNTIGDKVWFDADADGQGPPGAPGGGDTSEYGIPGVTVVLIRDVNNNGMWDANEPIVATDTTGATGIYLFTGLPDGSYLVWVSDTDNVLTVLRSTYDADGGVESTIRGAPLSVAANSIRGLSWVQSLGVGSASSVTNLLQDFGYTPINQQTNKGLIGDRVWLDIDGDTEQDTNEPGLEGVVVTLLNSSGVPIGTTTTDENGYYYFPNLSPGTYTVVVTPPSGMNQTFDADGHVTTPNQSTVTIGGGFPLVNLNQDFGYRGTGTIGNLVWEDLNANGVVDPGEPGIRDVTLLLYWDLNGDGQVDTNEPLIGHTTTGANGGYLFSGLPTDDGDGNANFVVRVTDDKGLLLGYWHSLGTPKVDNNSQTDPYAVTLTPGAPNNLTADFGYYIKAAALGNRVWVDTDRDGIQDGDEQGLAGARVTLTAKYFNGPTVTMVTTADANGFYSFGNLLLDEDHASSTTGTPALNQPVYTLSTATPSGYLPTDVNASGSTTMNDSDPHTGVDGLATQGQINVAPNADPTAESNPIAGYDFGFKTPPLSVLLANFAAEEQSDHVLVTWETVSEASNTGFNLYRSLTADGERTLLGYVPSQAPGSTAGAAYSFQDFDVVAGQGYWYVLEDIDLSGATALHGPVSVVFQAPTAVTLNALDADAGQTITPWMVLLVSLALIAAATSVAVRRRAAS
jgi:hypothetical protein